MPLQRSFSDQNHSSKSKVSLIYNRKPSELDVLNISNADHNGVEIRACKKDIPIRI